MPRVLAAGKLHPSGLSMLQNAPDITLDYIEDTSTEAMLPYLPEADAVLLRMQDMSASIIAQAPKMQLVSRHGVGFDAVDVNALNARGIALSIVGDVNAQTVAEHAMMLMLTASRQAVAYDAAARPNGDWGFRNSLSAREISGKTLLIIGFGRIGQRLARMALGFEIRVLAYDPYLSPETVLPEGVARVDDLHAAFKVADLVSLHVPKAGEKPILGAYELSLLPPNAVVVNTARGGLIDEDALCGALTSGTLHAAGLDVYAREPLAKDSDLLTTRGVMLTPHAASMSAECAERMAVAAARNILDFFEGRLDPKLVVNSNALG